MKPEELGGGNKTNMVLGDHLFWNTSIGPLMMQQPVNKVKREKRVKSKLTKPYILYNLFINIPLSRTFLSDILSFKKMPSKI